MWGKGNTHALLVEMKIGEATVEIIVVVPQQTKTNKQTQIYYLTPLYNSWPKHSMSNRKILAQLCSILLYSVRKWKHSRCTSTNTWITNVRSIYAVEFYLA